VQVGSIPHTRFLDKNYYKYIFEELNMYYIVYKTTNLVNGKIYIGAHRGDALDDSYLGSGHLLKYAIKKYGKYNFIRETLFVFDNREEMFSKEAELVTEEFVKDKNTYNMKTGGIGLDSSTAKQNRINTNQKLLEKYGEDWRSIISAKGKVRSNEVLTELRKDPIFIGRSKDNLKKARDKARDAALSSESKQKRKATFDLIGHQRGELNSQFGTKWITDGVVNKKISRISDIPDGWRVGRVLKSREIV
jgi:hypothetical protein